ncbi:kinase-like domain-containing protein [Leptodontidium sp. 2 PMI_412]|nr:kinase-like domain-containing protein [Leptodontidium sp. 2 PMI_412]
MLRSERVNSPFIVSPIFAIHSEVSASFFVDFGLSYLDVDPTTDISYSAPEELNSSVKTSVSNFWTLGVMFEMAFGFHPLYDTSRAQTMENILHGEVPFPDLSDLESPMDPIRLQIIDLCKKLLLRNPARRNGAVNYIKNHALFVDIDWEAIRRRNYQPA